MDNHRKSACASRRELGLMPLWSWKAFFDFAPAGETLFYYDTHDVWRLFFSFLRTHFAERTDVLYVCIPESSGPDLFWIVLSDLDDHTIRLYTRFFNARPFVLLKLVFAFLTMILTFVLGA